MLRAVCRRWWVLLLRGVAFVALGLAAMAWPGIPLAGLVWLFAAFALIDGASSVALGMRGESDGTIWWTMIFLGVLALAAAIIAVAYPALTLLILLSIVAAFAIVRGLIEIAAAVKLRKEIDDEWALGLSGLASILFGVLLLVRPGAGLVVIALLIGAYMVAIGVLAMALSLRLRRVQQRLATSA